MPESNALQTVRLPDKPSELIRLALADLRKVEAMPKRFAVRMASWHEPNGVCRVCLAGAVMAQTLQVDDRYSVRRDGWKFDIDTSEKLKSLDEFRSGWINDALGRTGNVRCMEELRWMTDYHDNRERFHADMEQLAKDLEAKGF